VKIRTIKDKDKEALEIFAERYLFSSIVIIITIAALFYATLLIEAYIIDGTKSKDLVYGVIEVYIGSSRMQLCVFSSLYDETTVEKFIDNITRVATMPEGAVIETLKNKRFKYIINKSYRN